MHPLMLFNLIILLCMHLPSVYAKCCSHDGPGTCGDGSVSTPCCGYGKCNAFCCACPGRIVIREEVEWQGTKFTTVLTAPSDSVSGQVTWTCRKSHVSTWYPAPSLVTVNAVTKRSLDEVSMAQPFEIPTMSPRPTPAPRFRLAPVDYRYPTLEQRAEQADQAELFSEVSEGLTMNGTMVVSKEAYLKYFKVSDAEIGTQYGQDVLAKFAMHDLDGDGFLTFAETEMLCDRDGC